MALSALPRLRVLHVLRAPVGGLFRHVCDLARAQAAMGHPVGVVCDADGDALTEKRLEALRPHLALGLFRVGMSRAIAPSDIFAFHAIRAHALGLGADVLHGHGAKGGAYSRLVGASLKRMGRRVASCYTPHGGSLHYHPGSIHGRIYMAAERYLARSSDGLIFESAFSARRYAAQVGSPGCVVQVIPNGLTEDDFTPVSADANAADFLFVGELRHLKGVDVMIDALTLIAKERPVRAVIVGSGPEAQAFRDRAASAGLADKIVFPGAMPAREAFPKGRVLVVPSRAESFPYIVLEAGAAGLPMLATDVGGIPEIVAGTGTALLPPEDVPALAAAMRRVLDNPSQAAADARELRGAVGDRFTIASMNLAILHLYYGALGQA